MTTHKENAMPDLVDGLEDMAIKENKSEGKTTYNAKQLQALSDFKQRISDLMKPEYEDHWLIKWLKARNFDVNKAEEMFRDSMAYRSKMNTDTLLTSYKPPEVIQKYMPGGFAGYDKEGSPILVELFGYLDFKGMIYSAKKTDIEKSKLQLGERITQLLESQSKKLGKRIDGVTCIIDMDKVGTGMLWGPGMQLIAHMGKVVQDNYPESVKRSFIVNAPGIFPMLWKMIRPLLTEDMTKKVCILGSNYDKELLKYIDADQLPKFLGGTMTDSDGNPRCPSRICQGGPIPEKYYLKDAFTTDHMITITVLQGDKHVIKFEVKTAMSILRWEFKTDGYDIAFGLLYDTQDVKGSKKRETVLAPQRVDSHFVPEDGAHTCTKAGFYYIVFDNTYSWARSKKVQYSVDILAPEDSATITDIDRVTAGGSWGLIAKESECTKL